ncbi:MAG TPA: HAMP domain-containing sensor histidine kinase [Mucilaginibacter sp.]|jgi:signal transduction histidine kinase
MKAKLKIVFILTGLALFGIVIFQIYWTVNAYKVNKEKFDANVDIAMRKAMDDCKKGYFDSIRRVIVRRLSPPETTIKIDTLHEKDTINVQFRIYFSNKYTSILTPFNITTPMLNFYRKKITHNATTAEALTEASFYIPSLMNDFTVLMGMYDIQSNLSQLQKFTKNDPNVPGDSIRKFDSSIPGSIYTFPPNLRAADSLKLQRYFKDELQKMHIYAPFNLSISTRIAPPSRLNSHYSETSEYSYKYHGFTLFHITGPEFFVRGIFRNPQYTVLKGMVFILVLSKLLILFTFFCFYYIVRTIIDQKKLADLKDDFINNMTHELKTPIATMTVAIEGLQKFNALNDVEKTQRYLQTSRDQLVQLNSLVTKVLDIAAFENKEIELVKEQTNINDLVNDAIETEKLKATKKVNITFTNKDSVEIAHVDKVHFKNVLLNLIDNAIKYSNEPANVSIACFMDGGNVIFSVKDNGIGIPADHIRLVFDKFHRVPTGNVHTVKGTGLGLSYVKYIVEAHGGDINVKSEINEGSKFIISIPLSNG